ncbi:MAG: hypothetical protein QTN59_14050 [Candidatus Electrothrix communis]|nr:MAG: hypothetical protein QTN59_14050 [Candidatus Electrothrix communis]
MTHNHTNELRETFEAIKALRNEIPWINIVADGDLLAPNRYHVEMEIRSITGTSEDPVYSPVFLFDILLPDQFPFVPPQCIAFPVIPFHPHFRIQKHPEYTNDDCGIWVDYQKNQDEELRSFLLRIAHSLQYQSDYIVTPRDIEIGNSHAFHWYQQTRNKHPEIFPTDRTILSRSVSVTIHPLSPSGPSQKKFKINTEEASHTSKKTFQIEQVPSSHKFDSETELIISTPQPEVQTDDIDISSQKKFEIINCTAPYRPQTKSEPNFQKITRFSSDFYEGREVTYRLYFTAKARKNLFQHINWEKKTEANKVEQGGLLLGEVSHDNEKGILYGIVHEVIPGAEAKGWSTYLEISHSVWKEMIDHTDRLIEEDNESRELQILGWYHTHPNNLGVFMSDTDLTTQRLIFPENWQYAVVLNPHTRIWKVFVGKDAQECGGFMINENKPVSSKKSE